MSHFQTLAAVVLAAAMAGCNVAPSGSPGADANSLVLPWVGRSACAGSVADVAKNLAGDAADRVEELQGLFEGDPGFLAVVSDGREAVIIVEGNNLLDWRTRLAPGGITVAPSCVDPALLALARKAASAISAQQTITTSAGYDAVNDSIEVSGVDTQVLLAAMERIEPGSSPVALAALAAGTLRINPGRTPGSRS